MNYDQLRIFVSSLVFSKLDYCNILYYGLTAQTISKLQIVQNSAARLVCKVNRFDSVRTDELFHKLHWLKVRERIVFKVLLTVHKCVNGIAPIDLSCFAFHTVIVQRSLMYNINGVIGDQAFSICGLKLWNAPPISLRLICCTEEFKKKLKTLLFKISDSLYDIVHRK